VRQGTSIIVHTGDLVQGVSDKTVSHLHAALFRPGSPDSEPKIPFLYISGNADWMHPSTPPDISFAEKAAVRAGFRERLAPLFDGVAGSVWVRDVVAGELRFVGVDNSTGQVSNRHPILTQSS